MYHLLTAIFAIFGLLALLIVMVITNPELLHPVQQKAAVEGAMYTYLPDDDLIVDGVHQRTGLLEAEGLMAVVNNCTNCHSAKIITQNRMNQERWRATIRWMQETQNLWDLGANEDIIINYLVTNYPIEHVGRRQSLTQIDWYEHSE